MRAALLTLLPLVVLAQTGLVPGGPVTPSFEPGNPGRSVVVFLPSQFFADNEYEPLVRRLNRAGLQVAVVSPDTGIAVSTRRVILAPDLTLADLSVDDFAALVLVSGPGMTLYWDDSLLLARCREFVEAGKTVAAIGTAPIALARAGVLKGRRAAVVNDRAAVAELRAGGATYSYRPLTSDRGIITAADADQAAALASAVARAVLGGRR